MADTAASEHKEIVIVRRGHGDHDDGHHGGVWKIAYADFMTAMMAFFLVMWLINAANEATRAQVASYFNPIKLTDSVTSDRGLEKPKNKPKKESADQQQEVKAEEQKSEEKKPEAEPRHADSDTRKRAEELLFKDPYAVLAQLAGEVAAGSPAGDSSIGAATHEGGQAGLKDGEAYRDPFDPQAWRDVPVLPDEEDKSAGGKTPPKREGKTNGETDAPGDAEPQEREAEGATSDSARETAKAVQKAIAESASTFEGQPAIAVKVTGEGLLISLTDTTDFGMFTVGSARPRAEVVVIMEKIAGILKDRPGEVVLRGHTDARPYRSDRYDNWRLSSARAQMAYYMLTRAGLAPERITRIEGHADRSLKRPDQPYAEENRRIEILLRTDGAP